MNAESKPGAESNRRYVIINTFIKVAEPVLDRAIIFSDALANSAAIPPMARRKALPTIAAIFVAVAAGCQSASNTAEPTTQLPTAPMRENQASPAKELTRPSSGEIPLGAIPPISGLTEPEKTKFAKAFTDKFPASPPGPDKIGNSIRDLTKYILEKLPINEADKVLKDINRLHNLSLFKVWGQVSGKASRDALKMVYTKLWKIGEAIARGERIFRGPLLIFYLSVPCENIGEIFLFMTEADIKTILAKAGCSPEFNPYNPQSYIDNIIQQIKAQLPQSDGVVLQAEITGDLTSRLNYEINQWATGVLTQTEQSINKAIGPLEV